MGASLSHTSHDPTLNGSRSVDQGDPRSQAMRRGQSEPIDSGSKAGEAHLLLILLSLVVDDVVEAELVDTLGGGDDTEPVTELLLLEVLLGPFESRVVNLLI